MKTEITTTYNGIYVYVYSDYSHTHFTFNHLADAFIQSNSEAIKLTKQQQYISAVTSSYSKAVQFFYLIN